MLKKSFDVSFEVKNIEENDDFFLFEGYASTFGDVDLGNDRVVKGAFTKTIRELKERAVPISGADINALLPVLWQHRRDQPVGSFYDLREDDKGLFVKAVLPKSDDLVTGRVMPQMRARSIKALSIGYQIIEQSMQGSVRNIEEVRLIEVSLVTTPMNEEATITSVKQEHDLLPVVGKKVKWVAKEAIERIEKADHECSDGFLYYSDEQTKSLPIADIVDGELVAIPRAIFSAVAAINGAKRLNISEEEQTKIKSDIDEYYSLMGLNSPFSKKYKLGVNEAKTLTSRDLEKFLIANNVFSKDAAKLIASKFTSVAWDADGEKSEWEAVQSAEAEKEAKAEKEAEAKLDKLISLF